MRRPGSGKPTGFSAGRLAVMLALASSDLCPEPGAQGLRLGSAPQTASRPRITVIAIDDHIVANLGRWPWPRDLHAKMTDLLAGAKARSPADRLLLRAAVVDARLTPGPSPG